MTKRISRRDFIKISLVGTAAVVTGCQQARRWVTLEPYVRPPEEQLTGQATWYASTCRQCPAGCGIVVRITNGRAVKIEGNQEHPLNRGKLCARGQAGLQVLYNPDRIQTAVRQSQRGSRQYQNVAWNEALNSLYPTVRDAGEGIAVWLSSTTSGHVADLFQRFTAAVGAPDPVIYDLYTAFHGYHPLQSASQTFFGQSDLPAYDLSHADVVFSFGANFLGTWLSSTRYGVEFGDFRGQPLGKRGYLVQFEPRMSITGAKADRWVPVTPGTEGLVAQALIRLIADRGFGSPARVERARALAADVDVNAIADAVDVPVSSLAELAKAFATAGLPVAIPGSALAGQSDAVDAITAVQALNVIASADDIQLYTESPLNALTRPHASSYEDVRALIDHMASGAVKVLMVHGANPAYDLPHNAGFTDALKNVETVISFSPMIDETATQADWVLPDRTYLESWGYDIAAPGFDLPVVSSQQPVVEPVVDARATADVLLTLARGIPGARDALPWDDEVTFLKETIAQLPPGAVGGSGSEVLWSRFLQHGGWWSAEPTAVSLPQPVVLKPIEIATPQPVGDAAEYPYFLHLYMSDLLSDGRGASQTWLQGVPDPMTTIAWQTWVEINPQTAQQLGVKAGDVVTVTSPHGEVEAPVYVYPAIRPDTVALPLGQGHSDYGRYAENRGTSPLDLLDAQADTDTGLAWAGMRVKVTRTGRKVHLATFENTAAVIEGYKNQNRQG